MRCENVAEIRRSCDQMDSVVKNDCGKSQPADEKFSLKGAWSGSGDPFE